METSLSWNDSIENILKSTGERAACYGILHRNAEMHFSKFNNYLALPTSILSTISGALSIGSNSIFGNDPMASVYIGLISLFTGVISTVNNYYGYAKRAENHRLISISYNKLFNFINVELSLKRNERMPPKNMLKIIRLEIERLIETSPAIPKKIIEQFNEKYKDETDIEKPPETNGLISIKPNREDKENKSFNEILGFLNNPKSNINSPVSPVISLDVRKMGSLVKVDVDN